MPPYMTIFSLQKELPPHKREPLYTYITSTWVYVTGSLHSSLLCHQVFDYQNECVSQQNTWYYNILTFHWKHIGIQVPLWKKRNTFIYRSENQKLCRACIIHLIYAGIKRTKAAHRSVLSQMFYLLCSSSHVGWLAGSSNTNTNVNDDPGQYFKTNFCLNRDNCIFGKK